MLNRWLATGKGLCVSFGVFAQRAEGCSCYMDAIGNLVADLKGSCITEDAILCGVRASECAPANTSPVGLRVRMLAARSWSQDLLSRVFFVKIPHGYCSFLRRFQRHFREGLRALPLEPSCVQIAKDSLLCWRTEATSLFAVPTTADGHAIGRSMLCLRQRAYQSPCAGVPACHIITSDKARTSKARGYQSSRSSDDLGGSRCFLPL